MAVSMIYLYGIFPQIISIKQNTMCGPRVYSYHFTNYVVFPMGVKATGLMSFFDNKLEPRQKQNAVIN